MQTPAEQNVDWTQLELFKDLKFHHNLKYYSEKKKKPNGFSKERRLNLEFILHGCMR